jgi:putative hydrolase of the HAD superfamily
VSNNRPRAIVFDAVGTLIHPDPPWDVVYTEVGSRHGSKIVGADLHRAFRAAFARQEMMDRAAGWLTSEAREIERWQSIVREVLHDVSDPAACFAELWEHFSLPCHWRCDPAARTVFAGLATQGYRLAMASNFDHRLRQIAAELVPLERLADVIISAEVGWRKPAREFFAAVCTRLGLAPGDILHVGDDPVNDYEGASAAGCRALLFDPLSRSGQQLHTIRQLAEISALTERD